MKICLDCLYAWEPTTTFVPINERFRCESCDRPFMVVADIARLKPAEKQDTTELENALFDLMKDFASSGAKSIPYQYNHPEEIE